MSLSAASFADLYRELWRGERPFAWQQDLVDQVIEHGAWPALVDVPTGLGKTALIDVAVFLTALTAGDSGAHRLGRRRIFFVVDRRIVVDQAARRAATIARRLAEATPGTVAAAVAARLATLVSTPQDPGPDRRTDAQLLTVTTMRGGVTWDASWLAQPDHLGIVTGTVDQIGSRLLFRGYGVSRRRSPIDAALVGTDSLILLDEAHLASALIQTVHRAHTYDRPLHRLGIQTPAIVQLTATGREQEEGWTYHFDAAAHLTDQEAVARERLTAAKQLTLVETTKARIVRELADRALELADTASARVLVVCNTVDRARAVMTQVKASEPSSCEVDLLIGRMRELDRERLVQRVTLDFGAESQAREERAAILVATQTVEVGIDLDATALVTECASWDSLVQRIGRVNRRGSRAAPAPVVVIHAGPTDSPVYGAAKDAAWNWLNERIGGAGSLDVSPLACRAMTAPRECSREPQPAPLLLPAHLDAWARTQPRPSNDPPVEQYLHGLDSGPAAVTLAWRDGLLDARDDELTADLEALPVLAAECVEVPIRAVRAWLSGAKATLISDWDDADDFDDIPFGPSDLRTAVRRALDVNGEVRWRRVGAADVRPGDTLVVPTEHGGLDTYGWSPSSTPKVVDVAELAAWRRHKAVLRVDGELGSRLGLGSTPAGVLDASDALVRLLDTESRSAFEAARSTLRTRVLEWLRSATPADESVWTAPDLSALYDAIDADCTVAVSEHGVLLRGSTTSTALRGDLSDDGVDGSVVGSRRVTLQTHHRRVAQRADEIASALGLDPGLRASVVAAARWHDLGKVDPRFQAMLFGGDEASALVSAEPIAKSGMAVGDRRERARARRLARMPAGARHEAWSAELVAARLDADSGDLDRELTLHLVASHHGHARPLLPPVADDADHQLQVEIDGIVLSADVPHYVDVEAAARFAELNRAYGRWGLALLEAVVRCADMTISGEGS